MDQYNGAKTLAPALIRDASALGRFLMEQTDQELAIGVMERCLMQHMVDGKLRHSVKTWAYFTQAIQDEEHYLMLEREGLRPGDLLGAARKRGA